MIYSCMSLYVYVGFKTGHDRCLEEGVPSLLRVGQPRLMPRAEKRVIEYFVSTQILQSILDLLHAAGKTERSELNAYAYCA